MSDLQRDIALVQATIAWGAESAAPFEAWQRIRARLTPDRERVARGVKTILAEDALDAAIDRAMLAAAERKGSES